MSMGSDLRKITGQARRVETGPIQFGNDWPGVFIQGVDALAYFLAVRGALRLLQDLEPAERQRAANRRGPTSSVFKPSTSREPTR